MEDSNHWQEYRTSKSKVLDPDSKVCPSSVTICFVCGNSENRSYSYSQFHKWFRGLNYHEKYGNAPYPSEEELAKRFYYSFWDYCTCDICHSKSGEGPNDPDQWSVQSLEERTWKPLSDIIY